MIGRLPRLTRRGVGSLILGALLMAASMTGIPLLAPAGVLAMLTALIGLVVAAWRARRLEVSFDRLPDHVVVGDPVPLTIRLTGVPGDAPPIRVSWLDDTASPISVHVVGGSGRPGVRLPALAHRRGRRRWRDLRVELGDQFGIAVARVRAAADTETIALPRCTDVADVGLQGSWTLGPSPLEMLRHDHVLVGGELTPEPREYRVGDDLRRIHWPATARLGDPMVRMEEPPPQSTLTLTLDRRPDSYGDDAEFEAALSVAAGILERAISEGHLVRLRDQEGVGFAGPRDLSGGAGRVRGMTGLALVESPWDRRSAPTTSVASTTPASGGEILVTGDAAAAARDRPRRHSRELIVTPGRFPRFPLPDDRPRKSSPSPANTPDPVVWSTVLPSLALAVALTTATAAIATLFTDLTWLPAVLWAPLSAVAVGAVLRPTRVSLPVIPLAQVAAFLLGQVWLVGSFGGGPLQWIASYRDVLVLGASEVRTTVSPSQPEVGLVAVTALAVFAAALMAETLSVGVRNPGAAGLVLLAMLVVPAIIVPTFAVVAVLGTAAAWLLMLAAEVGTRRPWVGAGRGGRSLLITLGQAAVTLLLAVLLGSSSAVPTGADVSTGWLRDLTMDLSNGPGGAAVDPLVDMNAALTSGADVTLLRYRPADGVAGYLSMVTLNRYDDGIWRPSEPTAQVPVDQPRPDSSRGGGDPVVTVVDIAELRQDRLPLPAGSRLVTGLDDEWLWDGDTGDAVAVGEEVTTENLTYRVLHEPVEPSTRELRDAASRSPEAGDTRALGAAERATVAPALREAGVTDGTSDYEAALRIQDWLARDGGFGYSLSPGDYGPDPLAGFLTERVGYCQQFASTMAVMARAHGIPSRVRVGFASGQVLAGGWIEVRGQNAHAWPELWFDGIGWVRFEPTPTAESPGFTPGYAQSDPAEQDVDDPEQAEDPTDPEPTDPIEDLPAEPTSPEASESAPAAEGGRGLWPVIPVLLGVILLAAIPALRRWHRRRARCSSGDPVAAWSEICDTARELGVGPAAGETPRQTTQRWLADARLPQSSRVALATTLAAFEATAYGDGEAEETTVAPDDVRSALSGLRSIRRRSGLRARLSPAHREQP